MGFRLTSSGPAAASRLSTSNMWDVGCGRMCGRRRNHPPTIESFLTIVRIKLWPLLLLRPRKQETPVGAKRGGWGILMIEREEGRRGEGGKPAHSAHRD
jgi:hypothetical protein